MLFYDSNATYVNQNIILQTGDVYVRMPMLHDCLKRPAGRHKVYKYEQVRQQET